jgi:hypothetical protein
MWIWFIIGLGLGTLFSMSNGYRYVGPSHEEWEKPQRHGGKCYKYDRITQDCSRTKRKVYM